MSKSTLSAKLLHAIDRIELGIDGDKSANILKEIHSELIALENENRDLDQQVSSLFSANSELSWPLTFCRCIGQFEELDLSSDQTGEYTSTCKRCGLEVQEEEDAVIELKANEYAALKSKLSEHEKGLLIEKAKEGVIHLVEKKDQSVRIGWLDDYQSPPIDWLTPDGDCIEPSEIKRVFPTGLTFPTYAFPSLPSETKEGS